MVILLKEEWQNDWTYFVHHLVGSIYSRMLKFGICLFTHQIILQFFLKVMLPCVSPSRNQLRRFESWWPEERDIFSKASQWLVMEFKKALSTTLFLSCMVGQKNFDWILNLELRTLIILFLWLLRMVNLMNKHDCLRNIINS